MRKAFIKTGVAVLCFASALAAPLAGQEATGQGNRGVQVGVPDGRNPGDGGASNQRRRPKEAAKPAPRAADGHALLGSTPDAKGLWLPGPVIPNPLGLAPEAELPFQPWARALHADRRRNQLEPHARCKPSGGARVFLTPYGVEIVEMPELQRVMVFDVGGPHTFRTIYMDGRTHPKNLAPTYYGHSIGWWEGDTLVVDTIGFNEGFWLDRSGLPHTTELRTLERFTRVDMETLRYELTIEDPGAYTAPISGKINLVREADTELFEYVCQQSNYAHELMVGDRTSIDRSSPIVP
jgi:hypothetical protein